METAWYFRLLIPWIGWFVCGLLLLAITKPKRMSDPGWSKPLQMVSYISIIAGWVLTWFIKTSAGNPDFQSGRKAAPPVIWGGGWFPLP